MILRILLLLSLGLHVSMAKDYKAVEQISLKKDQRERLAIKSEGSRRILEFRWTLYANENLVVLRNFDDSVTQHMLKLNHTNQSFRIELLPHTAYKVKVPYILVKFTGFDFQKDEGQFDIFLQDEKEEIEWEFLKSE